MRATKLVRFLPVVVLTLVSVGCENQQAMLDSMKDEKVEIEKQLSETSDKASELLAENEMLKSGVEAAKAAAVKAEAVAAEARDASAAALASAKAAASEAISKAVAEVEAKMGSAGAKTKKTLDAANAKVAEVQQQLEAANAKVGELEAALKKTLEPAEEKEVSADEES